MSMRDALRVRPGPVNLAGYDPQARPLAGGRRNRELRNDTEELLDLQTRLWAQGTAGSAQRILLVLQGIDTAGKGGVTRHVVGVFDPIGVRYTGFQAPTEKELEHDFLWRVRKRLPPAGAIGVFDRSHYEDVLIVRVHDLVPESEWSKRYDIINDFESELIEDGTTVLKVFLNIDFDTQRDRLIRRINRPDKHWKFNEADLAERAVWSDYQTAYEVMLEKCNTDRAPWYVVPSNHKKYRNWAVGELLRETLLDLDPHYPDPPMDIPALKARLAPPH